MHLITAVLISLFSPTILAATLCVGTCPGDPPPSGLPPALADISIEGAGYLELDFAGILYIDTAVYEAHLDQFTLFASDSAIIFDPIPADYPFPSYSEITTIEFKELSFLDAGIGTDAIIRNMDFSGEIRFHAVGDILVTNTSTLVAAPIPAALVLLLSGIATLGCREVMQPKKSALKR